MEAFARDTPIVVYCSVGYRSARVARWLGRQGFTNVRNLDGSLFAWANEGRPMEADGRPVQRRSIPITSSGAVCWSPGSGRGHPP